MRKKCTIGQDAQISGKLRTDTMVPVSALQITINNPRLTGTIDASIIAPVSPDAKVNIEFITCAAIIYDADLNNIVTIDGHVDIVQDKILSVDDVRKSEVNDTDVAIPQRRARICKMHYC